MALESALDRDRRQAELLDRLLSEKVVGRHGVFLETGEGEFMRDGLEEMSGYAVDAAGQHYWGQIGEYRRARERVGLRNT